MDDVDFLSHEESISNFIETWDIEDNKKELEKTALQIFKKAL